MWHPPNLEHYKEHHKGQIVAIRIYTLTPIGKKLARSVSNPDSAAYRVVHFLDQTGHSTPDQIADFCSISSSEASAILGTLRRRKIVSEVTETAV